MSDLCDKYEYIYNIINKKNNNSKPADSLLSSDIAAFKISNCFLCKTFVSSRKKSQKNLLLQAFFFNIIN